MSYQAIPGIEKKYLDNGTNQIPYYDFSEMFDADTIEKNKLWETWGIVDSKGRYYDLRDLGLDCHEKAIELLSTNPDISLQPHMRINVGKKFLDYNKNNPKLGIKGRLMGEYSLYVYFFNHKDKEPVLLNQELCCALYNIISKIPRIGDPFMSTLLNNVFGLGFNGNETLNTCTDGQYYQGGVNALALDRYLNQTHNQVFNYTELAQKIKSVRTFFANGASNTTSTSPVDTDNPTA